MNLNLSNIKQTSVHFPVLIREIISLLSTDIQVIVDCTFGAGGYSSAMLKYTKAKVIGIDRDKSAKVFADKLTLEYPSRFTFVNNTFSNIDKILLDFKIEAVDLIIADLGVSTVQIENKERGFSFKNNGPLSMAMGLNKFSAFDFINKAKESEIAKVIWEYGEEPQSRIIAKHIVNARKNITIETTEELTNIIHNALKRKVNKNGTNSATKSFQAIRIHVNGELIELIAMLNKTPYLINKNGKIAVVSFHSLEDRIVKLFFNEISNHNFNEYCTDNNFSIFKPKNIKIESSFKSLNKKVIVPQKDEIEINKNSSCSKLRVLQRVN